MRSTRRIADDGAKPDPLRPRTFSVRFRTGDGILHAVKGIDLDVNAGETVAIVGESGSGKSQTMMAVMGLLASNGWADGLGRSIAAQELLGLSPGRAQQLSRLARSP